MSQTPTPSSRLSITNPSLQLRLTPSTTVVTTSTTTTTTTSANSPYTPARPSPLRSPTKSYKHEPGISLRQVVGSTATSRNAFDAAGARFAYSAGAAAVVATYDPLARTVDQRFFRAKPTAVPVNPSPVVYDHGGSAAAAAAQAADHQRARAAPLRHAAQTGSPFGTPGRDWGDGSSGAGGGNTAGGGVAVAATMGTSTGKSWSARERVKAAACVSLSGNGRFLAVGEVGYNPRVIVFSTAAGSAAGEVAAATTTTTTTAIIATTTTNSDVPLTCLADHAFGVRCVAFSPDSRFLASLGTANDGFLYVWRVNERTGAAALHASNKCTSNVTRVVWLGSTRLVTIGTRHVKVWRVDDSNPGTPARGDDGGGGGGAIPLSSADNRTLVGRNCILGDLLEATYTSAVALSGDRAIVCSDKGAVCLLHDAGGHTQLARLASIDVPIRAALLLPNEALLVAGSDGGLRSVTLQTGSWGALCPESLGNAPAPVRIETLPSNGDSDLAALVDLDGLVGTLSTRGAIALAAPDANGGLPAEVFKLPAHGGAVLGVRAFTDAAFPHGVFFTWAGDGSVMLWNADGSCARQLRIPIEQRRLLGDGTPNELRVVRHLASANLLVTGDRLGVLRMCEMAMGREVFSVRAHSAEITDIAVHDGEFRYAASAGRDRVVQVFQQAGERWELLHTLDEHVGVVTGVAFSASGQHLLSCSSDRTVVVRDRASRVVDSASEHAFIIARTITLKGTPMAMAFGSTQPSVLHLSTIDRFVHRYDFSTGKLLGSFKSGDGEGGDTVVMSSLVTVPTSGPATVLAGLSSTDKSIRLYDDSGTLLARDWGHTEGVSDIAVLDNPATQTEGSSQASLVTVALDGTIFTWQADLRAPKRYDALARSLDLLEQSQLGGGGELLSRPPLRRVLSQSEVASFRAQTSPEAEDTPTRGPVQHSPPRVRRRVSRMSVLGTPKLEATPTLTNGGGARGERGRRRSIVHRSPSPPSPKLSAATLKRRKSMHPDLAANGSPQTQTPTQQQQQRPPLSKSRSASNLREAGSGPGGPLGRDTESMCRNLRIYRKKLGTASADGPAGEALLREIQKELSLTLRAVGEKAMRRPRGGQVDEEVLGRVLDQYSSKLVEMLDSRLAGLSLGGAGGGAAAVGSALSMSPSPPTVGGAEGVAGGGGTVLYSPIQEHADEGPSPRSA